MTAYRIWLSFFFFGLKSFYDLFPLLHPEINGELMNYHLVLYKFWQLILFIISNILESGPHSCLVVLVLSFTIKGPNIF